MVNIACDFVVLIWRRKCLSTTSKSNAKKQFSYYKNHLLRISKHYIDNKVALFLRYLWSYVLRKHKTLTLGRRQKNYWIDILSRTWTTSYIKPEVQFRGSAPFSRPITADTRHVTPPFLVYDLVELQPNCNFLVSLI